MYSAAGDLVNQCRNVEQDRGGAPGRASSSSSSTTTSSPRPPATPTSCCPPRPSGSATTCTSAVGGRGPLRDLHEAGHRARCASAGTIIDICADARPAASGIHGLRTIRSEERVAARADCADSDIDDFDAFRGARASPGSPRPRTRWPSPREVREPERHPSSRRRRARSRSTRRRSPPIPTPTASDRIPPIPTWIPARRASSRWPLGASVGPKSRARTHSTHDNQPILARADRAGTCGSIPTDAGAPGDRGRRGRSHLQRRGEHRPACLA